MAASSRTVFALVAFCISFVVNPGYFGCGAAPAVPEFGEAEMLELLDEANATAPFEFTHDGHDYRLEITLEQKPGEDVDDFASAQPSAAFGMRAYACGDRTFMASASACVTMSKVPLMGRFSLFRLDAEGETRVIEDRAIAGELWSGSLKWTGGTFSMFGADHGAMRDTNIELLSRDAKTVELYKFRTIVDGFPTAFVR